jgi:putative restriction endonuclease
MPRLDKRAIVDRLSAALAEGGIRVTEARFATHRAGLPWTCTLSFPTGFERSYRCYLWTVTHGGRTRSASEYRVQATLPSVGLEFSAASTVLLGYYSPDHAGANPPPASSELFVAWDPTLHIGVSYSASLQVPSEVLIEAHLSGAAAITRRLASGAEENIIVLRPEYVGRYFELVPGSHRRIRPSLLVPWLREGSSGQSISVPSEDGAKA